MADDAKVAPGPDPSDDLARIVGSARRLGLEIDEAEALQWLAAMAVTTAGGDVVFDTATGVFGHKVSMLDFNPEQLDRFREIGKVVGLEDRPGVVETALALSGSAAQSKIQSYPGDCDFFERVNIHADTRDKACQVLAEVVRGKAISAVSGPTFRLMEVRFGSYPFEVTRGGKTYRAGSSIAWSIDEIRAGLIEATGPDGTSVEVSWEQVAANPGWCKLDWVVSDPIRKELSNASNMLDATWEAPDGSITPLDGYLDPYFQEVYLEAESIPIFSKLARHLAADALDEYVEQLEKEVRKYLTEEPNYGKAAKRMYNVFRLRGRYEEAAYIRELFDEPATALYQVWALIRTLDEAASQGSAIPIDTLVAQADELIMSVIETLEGGEESGIVRSLLRLRTSLSTTAPDAGAARSRDVEEARAAVGRVVNEFFEQRLVAVPEIASYMKAMSGG